MRLRARLAFFLVATSVMTVIVAVLAVVPQLDALLDQQVRQGLSQRRAAAVLRAEAVRRSVDRTTQTLAAGAGPWLSRPSGPATQRWLDKRAGELSGRADFFALVGPRGELVVRSGVRPRFGPRARDVGLPSPALVTGVRRRQAPVGTLLSVADVRDGTRLLGSAAAGVWLDQPHLRRLRVGDGAALVTQDTVLAASGPEAAGVVPGRDGSAEGDAGEPFIRRAAGRPFLVTALDLPGSDGLTSLVLWQPAEPLSDLGFAVLTPLIVTAAVAGLLGLLLAGRVVGPLRQATRAARAAASGDFDWSLRPRGGRELEDLASAMNLAGASMAAQSERAARQRGRTRAALARLGEGLRGELDVNRSLGVVLESVMQAVAADRGALLLFTPERDALAMVAGRGVGEQPVHLRGPAGIAGHVARSGQPLFLPGQDAPAGVPRAAAGEPTARVMACVPVQGRGQTLGALTLLRDGDAPAFSVEDQRLLASMVGQAAALVDNVALHSQVQRLARTDPVTGLANLRAFCEYADRELESAARFSRGLGIVAVDGGPGDGSADRAAAQVAQALQDVTRLPDIAARTGPTAFVVLLPGTDLQGALTAATRIQQAIRNTFGAGARAGVAAFPDHGRTVSGLLRSAQAAAAAAETGGLEVAGSAPLVPSDSS